MIDEKIVKRYGYGDLAKLDLGYMATIPKTRNTCQRAKVDCKLKHGLSLIFVNYDNPKYEKGFKCHKCDKIIHFINRKLAI